MNRGEEDLFYKSHEMEVEDDFYPFELSTDEDAQVYKDSEDLFTAHEVLLAAQLGNALLLENRQLKEERETLHDKYEQQLEVRQVPFVIDHNVYF